MAELPQWLKIVFWPCVKCLEVTGLIGKEDFEPPPPSQLPGPSVTSSFSEAPARLPGQTAAEVTADKAVPVTDATTVKEAQQPAESREATPAPQTPEPAAGKHAPAEMSAAREEQPTGQPEQSQPQLSATGGNGVASGHVNDAAAANTTQDDVTDTTAAEPAAPSASQLLKTTEPTDESAAARVRSEVAKLEKAASQHSNETGKHRLAEDSADRAQKKRRSAEDEIAMATEETQPGATEKTAAAESQPVKADQPKMTDTQDHKKDAGPPPPAAPSAAAARPSMAAGVSAAEPHTSKRKNSKRKNRSKKK